MAEEPSQWDCLLQNLGAWQGSFARFSPQGALQTETPSLVTLELLEDQQTVRQTIQYFTTTGAEQSVQVLEYRNLNRSTLCFETGAFSQGSLQFSPVSEFGAELGLIAGDRRLRLVQQFQPSGLPDSKTTLATLTLIRESRRGIPLSERSPLRPQDLAGTWTGEAITLYPDWRSPSRYPIHLVITVQDNQLTQQLSLPNFELTSTATCNGNILRFESGAVPVQILLLPDGVSSNTPQVIPRGLPFFLEVGWLIEPNLRQRLIRSYDAKGEWVSLTLVTERKISSQ
jgi:Domain of unknown function (DUF3598)